VHEGSQRNGTTAGSGSFGLQLRGLHLGMALWKLYDGIV
jgi:hypothetical protein